MASLRETARSILDDARDGICWIAIWKTGRSWNAETMYGIEYTEARGYPFRRAEEWKIEEEDANRLLEIFGEDQDAMLVNGYYVNIGPMEHMTLATLMDGIEYQYGFGGNIMGILEQANRRETK